MAASSRETGQGENALYGSQLTVVTGGAEGADLAWARAAARAGVSDIRVVSFWGHNLAAGFGEISALKVEWVDNHFLQQRRPYLETAARRLGKQVGKSSTYTYKLLARNQMICEDAPVMYAVGYLEEQRATDEAIGVAGGTGWACQLFAEAMDVSDKLPLYVFDMGAQPPGWFQCSGAREKEYVWTRVAAPPNPRRFPAAACVGSRTLTPAGQAAIDALFDVHPE